MSVYEDIKTGLEQAIAYEKENNTKKEKAILIIDMPESCNECKIRVDDDYSNWCPYDNPEPGGVWEYVNKGTKPDWCPLKPMPEKYDIEAERNKPHDRDYDWEFEGGYNVCIDEILGI